MLSMCGGSSLSTNELQQANDNVSRVLCPGDSESAKLTPRAHHNDYTANEKAEIGRHATGNRSTEAAKCFTKQQGVHARGNTILDLPKFEIAKLYT